MSITIRYKMRTLLFRRDNFSRFYQPFEYSYVAPLLIPVFPQHRQEFREGIRDLLGVGGEFV